MALDNHVQITGNITRAPEMRYTKSGKAFAWFGIAWNSRKKVGDDFETVGHFFDVNCWDTLAENVCASLKVGDRVSVAGALNYEEYANNEGETQRRVKILAEDVAPSLRWATAPPTKIDRREGGGARNQQWDDEPRY